MKILGVIASSVFKIFTDNFNRTTAGSLGTPSGGGAWAAIKGIWSANGTKAVSATTPSSYAIATSDISSSNPTILLDVDGNGVGASFWVSDSSNWYGVFPWQDTTQSSNYTYGCSAYSSSCNGSYVPGTTCTGYGYRPDGGVRCTGTTLDYSQHVCAGYVSQCNTYTSVFSSYSYTAGSRYLRLIKSVANTVTTVADGAISSAAASIKVIVNSGGTITASAYTAAGQVTQTGSNLVNTPSSPTKATKHGILLAPGGASQATTVDNITLKIT